MSKAGHDAKCGGRIFHADRFRPDAQRTCSAVGRSSGALKGSNPARQILLVPTVAYQARNLSKQGWLNMTLVARCRQWCYVIAHDSGHVTGFVQWQVQIRILSKRIQLRNHAN